MDQQHLYKCQGTFVGHKVCQALELQLTVRVSSLLTQGPVWALGKHNELLFSASADCTIKVLYITHGVDSTIYLPMTAKVVVFKKKRRKTIQ